MEEKKAAELIHELLDSGASILETPLPRPIVDMIVDYAHGNLVAVEPSVRISS